MAEGSSDQRSAAARLRAAAWEHPGVLLSGGYLAATGIGMLTSWTFYDQFGIDIFAYAQLSDFLLAAFRHPMATLATLVAIPLVYFVMVSDRWLDRRFDWYKYLYGPERLRRVSRSAPAYALYFVLYAFAFSVLYSGRMAERVREGGAPALEVQLLGGDYLGRDGTEAFQAALLGSTGSYVFLYDGPSAEVTVVPVENVARLSPR
ncbi:MAG: hypothetical protein R3253_05645 [Longimicrobiales bacterium]|nr:hypothetical protein [Longimicrobiales bacterium]